MRNFYKGKVVLITGNTGFKGSWLTKILVKLGANVIGYSLEPNTSPSLFEQLDLVKEIKQVYADIRDFNKLKETFDVYKPEVVFHLAAQPLVKDSYDDPRSTYDINAMGTVNVLECCRLSKSVISIVNVTTDKVYKNNEWVWSYRENDTLDGYDPYSNSKSLSEIITSSYRRSFLNDLKIPVSTMRAGNVIGGGDYSANRIVPDCIRAYETAEPIIIRNPNSVRPYQHVLDPLFAYINIAIQQAKKFELASSYNIGPSDADNLKTIDIVKIFNEKLNMFGKKTIEINFLEHEQTYHEANLLRLDCAKYQAAFNWKPKWNIHDSIEKVVIFAIASKNSRNIITVVENQINEYLNSYGEIDE